MRVLTIVPARSGSKRLPGKNWEKVGGKTLLQLALDCIPGEGCTVIVSDAPERCPTEERGLDVRVMAEPADLAGDGVPMSTVVKWVCKQLHDIAFSTKRYHDYDAVLLLQPTSPLRTASDVGNCLDMFGSRRPDYGEYYAPRVADSVVSVTRRKRPDAHNTHFETNGAIYLMSWEQASTVGEIGGDTRFYLMPESRSIDIDTQEDLDRARQLWEAQHAGA